MDPRRSRFEELPRRSRSRATFASRRRGVFDHVSDVDGSGSDRVRIGVSTWSVSARNFAEVSRAGTFRRERRRDVSRRAVARASIACLANWTRTRATRVGGAARGGGDARLRRRSRGAGRRQSRFAEASMAREAAEATCRARSPRRCATRRSARSTRTTTDGERRRRAAATRAALGRDEDRTRGGERSVARGDGGGGGGRDELAEAAAADRARWEARAPRRRRHSRRHRRRGRWNAQRSSRRRQTSTDPRRGANAPEPHGARGGDGARRRARTRTRVGRDGGASVDVSPRRRSRRGDYARRIEEARDSGRSWRRVFGVSPTPKRTPSTTTGIAGAARPSRPRLPELFRRKRWKHFDVRLARTNARRRRGDSRAFSRRGGRRRAGRGGGGGGRRGSRPRTRRGGGGGGDFAAIADEFDADVEALETRLVRPETAAMLERARGGAERRAALEAWWIREASRRAAAAEEREASRRDAAERRAAWARREARLHEAFHDELRRVRLDDGGAVDGGTPWKWAHGDLDEEDATTEATLEARAATEARRRDATTTVFARVDRLEGVVELAARSPGTAAAARGAHRRRRRRGSSRGRGETRRRGGRGEELLRVIGGGFGDGSDDESARRDPRGRPREPRRRRRPITRRCRPGALEMVALFARNARATPRAFARRRQWRRTCAAAARLTSRGTPRANGSARPAGRNSSSASSIDRAAAADAEVRAHAALGVARLAGRAAGRRWLVAAGATPRVAAAASRAEPATARRAAKALCLMASSEGRAAEVREGPGRAESRGTRRRGGGEGIGGAEGKAEGALAERMTESAEELATDSRDRATNQTIHT